MAQYLTEEEAIEHIRTETGRGYRCLGADGIQVVPEGFMGRLDLIIDASREPMATEIAAAMTIDFIRANSAGDIVWDVVISKAPEESP